MSLLTIPRSFCLTGKPLGPNAIDLGHSHDPWLVLLAFLIAAFASYVSLNLGDRIGRTEGRVRTGWLGGAALSMGGGIWSMHFIAMLAFSTDAPVDYDPWITALSLVVAIAVTATAFHLVGRPKARFSHLLLGGTIMGLGVAAMHYVGMLAMQMVPVIEYDTILFSASVLIAMAAATVALYLAFNLRFAWQRAAAAIVMAVAICGMHYTGMAAASFRWPTEEQLIYGGEQHGLLAISVALGMQMILMLALLSVFADRKLKAANAAADAKSTFLATMSHEIRTPMNGVIGMIELLERSGLRADQMKMLSTIRGSSLSLLRIIDDILDFSKIEAQKLDIHPEIVSLKDLIEDVHHVYSGNASSKRLLITHRVDTALSPALTVDPLRLRQILGNFVSNAIKFTSHGRVEITADLIERKYGEDRVRFSVKDTGIGISEEHQRLLFQPFAQAESSTTHRFGGTGLGLVICRRLAALMGGSITMVSAPGAGTTMTLDLSLLIADPALLPKDNPDVPDSFSASLETRRTAPDVAQAEAEGTLILLADDHPTNRSLLMRQVNLLGYAAESARNGVEALSLWKSGRFSLLLTDCNMPEMDGYELAKTIRASEAATDSRHYPIIACTANAMGGEAEICLAAGMDDYLVKPVELKKLLAKLERWLPIPARPAAPPVLSAVARRARTPIDRVALARVSAGDAAVERDIFIEFERANEGDAALLRQAVADGDSAQVKRLAHLIKGGCAMVGALALANVCERIERASRDGDWKTIVVSMIEFEQELTELNRYLAEVQGPATS
jgi:signal transduction histidine kinase/HPt (histidine-containing phosphotransfer) domain-containing protein/FixJ family two-component response regulator